MEGNESIGAVRETLWLRQAGPSAGEVDAVTLFVAAVCFTIAMGVLLATLYFLLRYREGNKTVDRSNPPENNIRLEVLWIVIALLLSLGMFTWGARAYYRLYVPPEDALEIEIVGKQWMWMVRHPGGRREINQLHLPLGAKVRLKMISEDVIHSFYLPDFRTKHDVLPGRYTTIWVEPSMTGTFPLACAEYCGTEHSKMRGEVFVLTPAEYQEWAAESFPITPEQRGRRLFRKFACDSCHRYQGGQVVSGAPLLDDAWGKTVALEGGGSAVVDEEYVRRSILRPGDQIVAGFEPLMPTFEGRISEAEILDLTAFIRSLSGAERSQDDLSTETTVPE